MKWITLPVLLCAVLNSSCDRKTVAVAASNVPAKPDQSIPDEVTFNAHIRPIFSDTCFACHGFDAKKRKADLRLDTPEGAYAMLKDSEERAIVPGKPDESAVLKHIFSTDPEEVMPPPEFHKPFSEHQKNLVRAWIEQGAKYEEHWAFTPIVKPAVPDLAKHADEVANPIDSFVLAKLEHDNIDPSPAAGKATLLRRLSLDLTGLPPSPEEVAAFLTDNSPDAYEKQVDRLLASPRYGERMAVPWLDVVRFADTVGYHGDQNMRIFPYRDYVIKSFNDNKPFDQFTIEQLAGDLLPNATDEQKIATGFLRLNLVTREGGAQTNEYLAKYLGDRVRSVGAAWLGLTTGCAECHDHKFDPITSKDYYSLGAFFADIRQWGVYSNYNSSPNPDLREFGNTAPFPPEIIAKNAFLEKRIVDLQSAAVETLAPLKSEADENAFREWTARAGKFLAANPNGWNVLTPAEVSVEKGTAHEITPEKAVLFTGPAKAKEVATLRFALPEQAVRTICLEVLPDARNDGKIGRGEGGGFTVTPTFAIVAASDQAKPLEIAWSQADRRTPLKYDNGYDSPLLEKEWRSAKGIMEEPRNATSLPHHALYHLAEPIASTAGLELQVTLASADIGKVRVCVTPFGDAIPGRENAMRNELASALRTSPATLGEPQTRELAAAWIQGTRPDANLPEAYKKLRSEIIECRGGYAHSLVVESVPKDKILATHILPRGNWMAPAEEVKPAVPEFLPHASVRNDGTRLDRLDLAKWILAPENPLTARAFTNRLWKQFFGNGISNVLDDLGNQGEWPSHPKLLDWLASEFRDSGWDVKHMVRLIVTSRTYRQQSAKREDLAEIDPANRLLAEQSPRRLDAEFVRDNALFISGLLNLTKFGGPSVMPYQPEGYYESLNFPTRDYHASTGSDQYARGLYMHWQRTFMHPMLAAFDAPSREICTADRFQSNSPQQALALLNDPSFVEAARAFALRLDREHPKADDGEKIRHAMNLALARDPKPDELESLGKFLTSQRTIYQSNKVDAEAFLKTGLSDPGTGHDPSELAAWTQLCRVILNLHETITRY